MSHLCGILLIDRMETNAFIIGVLRRILSSGHLELFRSEIQSVSDRNILNFVKYTWRGVWDHLLGIKRILDWS